MEEEQRIRTSSSRKTISRLKFLEGWVLLLPFLILMFFDIWMIFKLVFGLRTSTISNLEIYYLTMLIFIFLLFLYFSLLLYVCFSRPTQGKLQNSTIVLNRRVIVTERMLRSNNFVVERQPILYIKESRRCFKIGQSWYSSFIVPKECLSHEQKDAIRRLKTKIKSEKKR